jgi:FkbM family methyltransferase
MQLNRSTEDHLKQREEALSLHDRYKWVLGVRPMALADRIARLVLPTERRRIVETDMGIKLYVDPFSNAGSSVLSKRTYEPETLDLLRKYLHSGDRCLDIGANEGILSAFMGKLVGPTGMVACVEPQSRLRDIIEINLQINGISSWHIFQNVLGGVEGDTTALHLWPFLNTGASGLMRKAKLGNASETVEFISPEAICRQCEVGGFDMVKVDVEGFEHQVVAVLQPLMKAGKIKNLLLDYHAAILKAQNINPKDIHESILSCGMSLHVGSNDNFESYRLYSQD